MLQAADAWSAIGPAYRVQEELGQGSYGEVARALHIPTGESVGEPTTGHISHENTFSPQVAIKCVHGVFNDPRDARCILRELRVLRSLDHPNIVKLRDVLVPSDLKAFNQVRLVFECLPTDLQKLLHGTNFLGPEHVRWLFYDLLKALKYLHSANVIHRDLKPANTLLSYDPMRLSIWSVQDRPSSSSFMFVRTVILVLHGRSLTNNSGNLDRI